MKRIQRIMVFIGIVIMVTVPLLIGMWEFYMREKLLYSDVLVAVNDIAKGTEIRKEEVSKLFTTVKIDEARVIPGAIKSVNEIEGKKVKQFIPKNSQLHKDFFDKASLVTSKEQLTFKVPSEWLIAVPSSIRRGDKAFFYEIEVKKDQPEKGNSTASQNLSAQESQKQTALNTHDINSEWLQSFDITKFAAQISGQQKIPKLIATVAYIKDSANREVVTVGNKERYDGSSKMSDLEIYATLKEIQALEESVKSGYRFVIMYQEN